MTPDQLRALFDGNWIMIAFAIGLVWKYVPALKEWANWLIPWINLLVYIVTKLVGGAVVGDAHAQAVDSVAVTTGQASAIPNLLAVVIGGFTNTVWASQVYERLFRGLIEKFWPKAAKAASQSPVSRAHA